MRTFVAWTSMFMFVIVSPLSAVAQNGNGNGLAVKPNYEMASKWTLQKVGKLVFDTPNAPLARVQRPVLVERNLGQALLHPVQSRPAPLRYM